ncbi:MAG: reverse transcriptase domain-containing protein, partial [Candidatus Thiodiazotropha endolucinida]|nr:hypothetical protein [Candidatus Thiodiazotropha taylori]MCW4263965.1 reverse transcriptase domain-containing protein [Candidatus Thiodiazotropha endolucinida]
MPKQTKLPFQKFNRQEEEIIDKEIQKLLEMEVISEVSYTEGQFISPIFTRPKKDGEYRMILNLKELNSYITYRHFKLDTFETALHLVTPNCFMAVVDLRQAYYSVPIADSHRRYLRFIWKDKTYEYSSLPNGVACAPRYFTKLLKPVYAKLRQMGHKNSGYIDDSLLLADTENDCEQNVKDTVSVMSKVGFLVHKDKSVFKPSLDIGFLGNRINSEKMIVYLPKDKMDSIVCECQCLMSKEVATIREVAHVTGLLVSTFSAVQYGPLFYREIEKQKILALKQNQGNFEAKMKVTDNMRKDLVWWIHNLHRQVRNISWGNPDKIITTDASL